MSEKPQAKHTPASQKQTFQMGTMRLADSSIEQLTRSAAQTATPFIHTSRCFLRQKSDFLGKQVFLGKGGIMKLNKYLEVGRYL